MSDEKTFTGLTLPGLFFLRAGLVPPSRRIIKNRLETLGYTFWKPKYQDFHYLVN